MKIDGESLLIADEPDKHGFENIAGLLSVSPSRLERFLAAARKVSRLAMGDPTINPKVDAYTIPAGLVQAIESVKIFRSGAGEFRWNLPFRSTPGAASRFCCNVQVYMYHAGVGGAHELDVRIDGVGSRDSGGR